MPSVTIGLVRSVRRLLGSLSVACLLLYCGQAGLRDSDSRQVEARRQAFALLEGSQNEARHVTDDRSRALAKIKNGLEQTREDPLQHGLWLQTLWFYLLLNDELASARDVLEESLAQLEKARASPAVVADVTSDLSLSLMLLGEVAKAKDYLRRAIVLAGPHERNEVVGNLYYSLGDAYRKTGDRRVSRRYFEIAREIYTEIGSPAAASAELKLGNLARDDGDYAVAEKLHKQALVAYRDQRNYREIVGHIELARDYIAQGVWGLAEEHARRAREDLRALPEQRIDATLLLLRISNDRRAQGHEGDAAIELIGGIESIMGDAASRFGADFVHPTQRLQFAEQAIRHYALEGEISIVAGYADAAIRLAYTVAEDLHASSDDSLAWLAEAQPVINAYIKALYSLDRARVFPILETYYGRQWDTGTLDHAGSIGHAIEAETVDRFERYRNAEQALVTATAELDRFSGTARSAQARMRFALRLRERDLMRDTYLAAAALPVRRRLLEPQATIHAQQVAKGDVLIRYFVQEDVSFGVAIAGDEVRYFDLPPRSSVRELVQSALDALQVPGQLPIKRIRLAELARLFPPEEFLARHGVTRLVIVTDDAMQLLPFAAVDLARGSQSYMPALQRFEIVRTKSGSRYYQDREPPAMTVRSTAAEDIFVFADPATDANVSATLEAVRRSGMHSPVNLPSARVEAAAIAELFTGRVTSFIGAQATNEALLSSAARSARILHIATHGYYVDGAPEIVGLATSVGIDGRHAGFIGLPDLFTQPFSSQLVVLSGCETMRGKDYNGWGIRSVADGFLVQGAGSVIGSLWKISDAGTAKLMAAFYRHLHLNGGNTSRALSAAQRELLTSGPFSDPYYWGGVVLESTRWSVDQHLL